MKRLVGLLVVVVGYVFASVPLPIIHAKDAVYNLWIMHGGSAEVICTGTIVRHSNAVHFLSAGHCVADNPEARYWISQSADPDYLIRVRLLQWKFEGIERWKEGDWALFSLPANFISSTVLELCELPKPGDDVWSWTGPLGMLPIIKAGIYTGPIHFPGFSKYEDAIGGMPFVELGGAPGSSGSAALRLKAGKVCVFGILVGHFNDGPSGMIVANLPRGDDAKENK